MAAGFISLPSELICHILLLLTPKDICHCAMTCKTVCAAARDSVHIQYKLELYAQGFTETAALDLVDFSTKMSSLKKLASLWRTDFYTKPVFEEVVGPVNNQVLSGKQHVKCGLWWTMANSNLCIRDCNANGKLSQTWSTHSLTTGGRFLKSVIVDPLQDLLIIVSSLSFIVIDAVQDYQVFMVEFRLASSNLPHPDSACAFLECTHTPDAPGQYASYVMDELAICGDRIVVLYRIHPAQDLFIQVIDWRKGHAKSCPTPFIPRHCSIAQRLAQTLCLDTCPC
ncbi:hypothetical protein K503DRAFT_529942 [Rhizopogon vinicolor AM-OR11-026]|uniref:F-box domain-containing protein n=1 Tax=Rhizopogon vinicolor AM-OR11-026 TaxID=1314800 RepID=A0A1B7ML48_9AGAM|nr:hypothetical protein K503DRAFT_529942 [Rhizopogon vinicolor AM-OR11-026]